MNEHLLQSLGQPDMTIAGWRLWVTGRDREDWFKIWTSVQAPGARVNANGPIVHASNLAQFLDQLKSVYAASHAQAELDCWEPNLGAKVTIGPSGQGKLTVSITPEASTQSHEFIFDIDRTYLPDLIDNLQTILARRF